MWFVKTRKFVVTCSLEKITRPLQNSTPRVHLEGWLLSSSLKVKRQHRSSLKITSFFSMSWSISLRFIAVANKWYYIILRITNRNDFDIVLVPSDNDPPGGFVVLKKKIVVIKKKIKSPLPITFEASLKTDLKKKLFINYKSSLVLKPLPTEGAPITITVTTNGKW